MSALTITLTGVFGLDALSLYKTEKRFSSMAGNISSAKTFAQDNSIGLSRLFCTSYKKAPFPHLSERGHSAFLIFQILRFTAVPVSAAHRS